MFIFFGGMVQIFGAIGEWILGNTFSCVLFFTYGEMLLLILHWRLAKYIECQGTFFIAQGTMLIPSFGVGTLYSPSGDSLEGMETVEFKATVGMNTLIPLFLPHYSSIPCIPKSFDRILLRHSRHPYHHLPHMLHPHQLLSFRNPASAGCDLRAVCRCLLRVGAWK